MDSAPPGHGPVLSGLETFDVLGVKIHAVSIPLVLDAVAGVLDAGGKGYVCVTGVHGVMESQRDAALRSIHQRATLVVPDGMPLVWIGRRRGYRQTDRVYGPDLMLAVCRAGVAGGWKHFFYGGKPGVADLLCDRLARKIPGLKIAGTYSPPFRALQPDEEEDLQERIKVLKPDFFWVGLSTPKQEVFMARMIARLDVHWMFGVGAAFDLHAGLTRDAPDWMKRAGLQWCHRLYREPVRLWRRYLFNNPRFLLLLARQSLKIEKK